MATWTLLARSPSRASNGALPLISLAVTVKHLGISAAVAETPYTPRAWARLAPGCGIIANRDGVTEFEGNITERQVTWDRGDGQFVIKVSCTGDEQLLADRLVFPDPLRAPDDQTVSDYWRFTGTASAAMTRLISDQAGPTCRPDRAVAGLRLGPDPGVGGIRGWQALFSPVLSALAEFSIASGTNLGVRVASTGDGLVASLYAPRDLTSVVRFSADLTNLVGFTYTETAPTVTDALSAGQGDLRMRLRRYLGSTDQLALRWGRRIWSYIDRRDTAEVTDLDQANADALADGVATVSLTVQLTDTQAAAYRKAWLLGDKVSVRVGGPDQVSAAAVDDVVREIRFDVNKTGAETIRPAIGTADAKAVIPPPSVQKLTAVGRDLASLQTRK